MTGLLLEDGELFPGEPVGAAGAALGEAVFATAMTGYQELVTDPSYAGQILCFTAPMVGNYGVAPERSESAAPQVSGGRHARGTRPGVDGLAGRARRRRPDGRRHAGARAASPRARRHARRHQRHARGDPRAAARWRARRWRARCRPQSRTSRTRRATCASRSSTTAASARSSSAWRPPARPSPSTRTTSTRTSWPAYDGVVLSNGPGDPEPLRDEIATVSELLGRVPAARHLPRPSAARAGDGPRDVQAALRPPRREPPRARAAYGPRARDEPEPRVRSAREPTSARRRTSRSTTAPSRGSTTPSCARARCSSTPRPGRGRTTRAR